MSKISRTQIELNVLETFTTIQDIPIPEEICIEWLLPDMKIEEAMTFLQRLKEKGALQFEEKQAEYTIQSAWLQPVCCQDRVKENYNRLVELNGDSLEKQDLLKSKKYIKFTESVLENIKPVKETWYINLIISFVCTLVLVPELEKAENWYKHILKIQKELSGESHYDMIKCYDGLAEIYVSRGQYEKAQELCIKSLKIRNIPLDEYAPDMVRTYSILAEVYSCMGEYEKGEHLLLQVLEIQKKTVGLDHPDVVRTYGLLAQIYRRMGEELRACELWQKSLKIYERVFDSKHPAIANICNNLANTYERMGEYDRAEDLWQKSLRINKELLGENHSSTAISYANLAGVCHRKGEYATSVELYRNIQIHYIITISRNIGFWNFCLVLIIRPEPATSYNIIMEFHMALRI